MKLILIGIVAGLACLAVYVRLAPSDPVRWHALPGGIANRDLEGGAMRLVETGAGGLARLDAVARSWPRTRVLAGSTAEGMITYVTRSAFWGFPDYTTARERGGRLEIYARSRFGRGDFGVNRARLEAWLAEL